MMIEKFQATPDDFRRFAKDGCYFLIAGSLLAFIYLFLEKSIDYQMFLIASFFSIATTTLNELNNEKRQHLFAVIQVVLVIIVVALYAYSPTINGTLMKKISAACAVLFFFGIYGFYLRLKVTRKIK